MTFISNEVRDGVIRVCKNERKAAFVTERA
jgi:hypothetical protein